MSAKHTTAYRARRQRMRHARKYRLVLARLEAFGKLFRARIAAQEAK